MNRLHHHRSAVAVFSAALISLFALPSSGQFRPELSSRAGVPDWELDPDFKDDAFTFARVRYTAIDWGTGWGRNRWATDYPEAELNLSFRLQQMTSMKVNPNPVVVEPARDDLSQYPFIYIVEPGGLDFTEQDISALRPYLLNGGFLMLDDFWGLDEWHNVEMQIGRLFPDRDIIELDLDHPIFNIIFQLKEKPQVPHLQFALQHRETGRTWEREDYKEAHYRAVFDDKGRMMVLICGNTDLADGWEREGDSEWYFREFAEKLAYPMAINILFYTMTH